MQSGKENTFFHVINLSQEMPEFQVLNKEYRMKSVRQRDPWRSSGAGAVFNYFVQVAIEDVWNAYVRKSKGGRSV